MAIQLEGKVAIITGASSGIGAATARAMAKVGIDVVLVARRRARLEEVAKSVRDLGRSAHVIVGDVSDMRHVTAVLDEAENHFGRFDIVFANAGYGMERPVHLMEDTELRAMFEVNFFSSVALLRESAKRLCAAKRPGHLLMCSSCLSKFSMPNLGAYAASKAAQESICRAMRFELAADHIEVASVHPITTTTEFFSESSLRSGTQGASIPEHAPKWFIQSPDRVADAIVACLRRPRSEVWTSHIVRFSCALFIAFPWMLDAVLRSQNKKKTHRRAHASKAASKVH